MTRRKVAILAFLTLAFGSIFGASLALPNETTAQSPCCRVTVRGCDRQANVCVGGASCGSDAERRAREAFESAYSCRSTSVASYIGTCSGERCEINLR